MRNMIEDIHRMGALIEACGAVAKPSAIAIGLTLERGKLVSSNAVRVALSQWRKAQREQRDS